MQREEEQRFGFSHLHMVTSTKLCAACVILGCPGTPPDHGVGIAVCQAANGLWFGDPGVISRRILTELNLFF